MRHASKLNGKFYRVEHMFRRRNVRPPKISFRLIDFVKMNFFGPKMKISARFPFFLNSGATVQTSCTFFLRVLQVLWSCNPFLKSEIAF